MLSLQMMIKASVDSPAGTNCATASDIYLRMVAVDAAVRAPRTNFLLGVTVS